MIRAISTELRTNTNQIAKFNLIASICSVIGLVVALLVSIPLISIGVSLLSIDLNIIVDYLLPIFIFCLYTLILQAILFGSKALGKWMLDQSDVSPEVLKFYKTATSLIKVAFWIFVLMIYITMWLQPSLEVYEPLLTSFKK
jgi:hypothetical protein